LAGHLPGDPPAHGLRVAAIRLARGYSAADTADDLGWTTRTLHRRCLDAFGYGPSVLRRVLRFRRAVALLRAGVTPAETAARVGYADQPHLSREVRALAGVSPGRLTASHPA
jgi:AraC-like DNA-binding protein